MSENPTCSADLAMEDLLSPTYYFDQIHDQIMKVHANPEKIFPFVDIKSAEQSGSLAKLKALPAMSAFVDVFRKAGLDAQIGYNISSCDISLTLNVKVLLQPLRITFLHFLLFSDMRMTVWPVSEEESAAA